MNKAPYRTLALVARYYQMDYAAIRRNYGSWGVLMLLFWTKFYAAFRRFDQNGKERKPTFHDVEKWMKHKDAVLRATQNDQDADHAANDGKDNCQPVKTTSQR